MGLLVDGVWQDQDPPRTGAGGAFVRPDSSFRGRVSADGSSGFPAEAGRYHLYTSLGCPWAHRTLLLRSLKGLHDAISISIASPVMGREGWRFRDEPGCIPDTVNGAEHLHQIYTLAKPYYTGRVTVPVLWDRERKTIVSNESSEIIRMLNAEFGAAGAAGPDYCPEALRDEIDAVNAFVYERINDGVYRCGFAASQEAYERAYDALFAALDLCEARLAERRYLLGSAPTEADWRLFPTLVRFDAAYYGVFRCNARRLVDMPNLWAYARDLHQTPGVAETVNLDHIKRGYGSMQRGPGGPGIVPKGPELDFAAPHGREALG